jgi:hypothetical protein
MELPADRANRQAHETELAATAVFADQYQSTLTFLQPTLDHAATQQAEYSVLMQENTNLQATLTFEKQIVAGAAPPAPTPIPESDDTLPTLRSDDHYQNSTITSGVTEADGCPRDNQDTYYVTGANDPTRIYFATYANDVLAGTVYRVNWYYLSELRYQSETWVPNQNYDQICIYFWLQSSYTPYQNGFWSAELTADGYAVARERFAICEQGQFC